MCFQLISDLFLPAIPANRDYSLKHNVSLSLLSYRHPERSRGIFVAAALLFPLLIRLHEAPYPSNAWSIRLPVSVHTHTPIDRKRKRFLACARNDMRKKIAPHSLSYRRRFQPTKTARQNKKNQPFT